MSIVSTSELNRFANEPQNLRAMGYTWVDLSAFYDRPGNVALGDRRGAALFAQMTPGVYEGHFLFSSDTRGRDALVFARDLIREMFTTHGATAIVGQTPVERRHVRAMSRALGFAPAGESVDAEGRSCVVYRMERTTWVRLSAGSPAP